MRFQTSSADRIESRVMQCCFRNLTLAGVILIVACGGDSAGPTAPTALSAHDALQSLTKGLTTLDQSAASSGTVVTLGMLPQITSAQAPPVNQIIVSVDGTAVQMFALAQRLSYPAGTCLEQLLGIYNFASPGSCTSPPGALSLIFWQTSSVSQAPERMIVVLADTGTASFADLSSIDSTFLGGAAFPALAFYAERSGAMWMASGGSITSAVAATGQSCMTILPPFAKSASCGLGSFSESGSLTFHPLDLGGATAIGNRTLTISAQVLNGMIQTVTATAPISFPTS